MNKTINVSVSGIAFIFDSEAYEALKEYLNLIQKAYKDDISSTEIIGDIEGRIAELILSQISDSNTIVTVSTINSIIEQMGMPQEDGEQFEKDDRTSEEIKKEVDKRKITRRLYRNMQGAKIGGVFNGFATFFSIDVTILRVLFVAVWFILFIFMVNDICDDALSQLLFVYTPFAYILLWIIFPVAKNARQKMEMMGEPITAESLKEEIKDTLDEIHPNEKNSRTASLFTEFFYALGRILRFFIIFLCAVVGITIISGVLAIIGVVFFSGNIGNLFDLIPTISPVAITIVGSLALLAPLTILIYSILRILFSVKWHISITLSLIGLWVLSWVGVFVISHNITELFRYEEEIKVKETIEVKHTSINISNNGKRGYGSGPYQVFKDGFSYENVDLELIIDKKQPDTTALLVFEKSAHGASFEEAFENCEAQNLDYSISTSKLYYPSYVKIENKDYKAQEFDLKLYVSPNTRIFIDKTQFNRTRISYSRYFNIDKSGETVKLIPKDSFKVTK
ncbi:MAG: PspC domain-containing protein [Rikenellaceae bacterium]